MYLYNIAGYVSLYSIYLSLILLEFTFSDADLYGIEKRVGSSLYQTLQELSIFADPFLCLLRIPLDADVVYLMFL